MNSQTQQESVLDFVISTAKSSKAYFSRLNRWGHFSRGFNLLVGSGPVRELTREAREEQDEEDHVENHMELLADKVRPLTETQGDRSWRTMRGYSCTSSCMDKVIRAKAPYIADDDEIAPDWAIVAKYAGIYDLMTPTLRASVSAEQPPPQPDEGSELLF